MSKKIDKKTKKNLKKADYYCLCVYGFSIFDRDKQEILGVNKDMTSCRRAVSTLHKMYRLTQEKKIGKLFSLVAPAIGTAC